MTSRRAGGGREQAAISRPSAIAPANASVFDGVGSRGRRIRLVRTNRSPRACLGARAIFLGIARTARRARGVSQHPVRIGVGREAGR